MLDKRLLRACAFPSIVSIAAIAVGGIVSIAVKADPTEPHAVYAAAMANEAAVTRSIEQPSAEAPAAEPTATSAPKRRIEAKPPQAPTATPTEVAPPAPAPSEAPQEAPVAGVEALVAPEEEANARPSSLFDDNQLIVYYGTPLAPGLGVLGTAPPQEIAQRLKDHTRLYDDLNGDRKAVGVMDLIYGVVQAEPTANGLYLSYLSDDVVNEYIRVAEEQDLQIILDLQIGRSTVAAEVEKVERFLKNPRVHVAIDPEYAVGPNGYPILTPGVISGHDINGAQLYLEELTEKYNLPPKMLVVHQFMDQTIIQGEVTADLPNVDLVLNMDAFGDYPEKVKKYKQYMARPYAQYRSFNIFLKQDRPVGTEQDVLALDPMPDMVMYQ